MISTFFVWAESIKLERIVVTPYRSSFELDEVARSVDLITREEIEKENPRNISDLLDDFSSVYIHDYGALGALKSVDIRGMGSARSLILINGFPINNPRSGGIDLSFLPVDFIEKIEILRGPASAIYGANAVGGVVNIITKKKPLRKKIYSKSYYGSYETFINENIFSQKFNNSSLILTTSYRTSDGHRENSDFYSRNFFLNYNFFYNKGELNFSFNHYQDQGGLPGSKSWPDLDDRQEQLRRLLELSGRHDFFPLSINYKLYYSNFRLDFIETPQPLNKDTHDTVWYGIDFNIEQRRENHSFILGYNYQDNKNKSSKTAKHSYYQNALYALLRINTFEPFWFDLGLRFDDYSHFGSELTPSTGLSYRTDFGKFYFNYAHAYRVPTFNDLYWPDTGWAKGNPNLRPEKARNFEAGFETNLSATDIGISYFHSRLKDMISWTVDTSGVWMPQNINRAIIQGVEFKAERNLLENLKLKLFYTFLRARDREREEYLIYRPKHKLNLILEYDKERSWFRIKNQFLSERFTDTSNTRKLNSYFVVDLHAGYRIKDDLEFFLSIYNLLNRKYARVENYPLPGFTFLAGIKFYLW